MQKLYQVIYDEQCEICQAGASWLRLLDKNMQVELVPLGDYNLSEIHPSLQLENCVRQIHIVTFEGDVLVGWDGLAELARLFRPTWVIGVLARRGPGRWLGHTIYNYIARNRYALSKCRGRHCRATQADGVGADTSLQAFWSCWVFGFVLRLPLIAVSALRDTFSQVAEYVRTRRKRFDLLNYKLSILFVGGVPSDLVPVAFGERFTAIVYDGLVVDPGSSRMWKSLWLHLALLPADEVCGVAATHHHEEHVGNLNSVAEKYNVPIYTSAETARLLVAPSRLPWIRRFFIGQPPPLSGATIVKNGDVIRTATRELQVFAAPGHSDDHVVFYDPAEKLLLAGDAFMGSYFATPNPDVDSRRWIETLHQLLQLDIEILVEGHGHIHTMRADIPDIRGLVVREHPREALLEKLEYLQWVQKQIEIGVAEGLPLRAIEATCFPWGKSFTWERFLNDEVTRILTWGHFSRTELIRSFMRKPSCGEVLPLSYTVRLYRGKQEPDRGSG